MDRETLDAFIEKQCEQAALICDEDSENGYQQAEMIEWAIDRFIKSNFKEE